MHTNIKAIEVIYFETFYMALTSTDTPKFIGIIISSGRTPRSLVVYASTFVVRVALVTKWELAECPICISSNSVG